MAPAKSAKIIQDGFRQVAHIAIGIDAERPMAFRQFCAVRPVDQRNMGVYRCIPAKCIENPGLTEGIREMVIAADRMGHAHVVIVDNNGKHVGGGAVRPQHDQVVELAIGNRDAALNSILDHSFAVLRRLETNNRVDPRRCVGWIAVAPGAVIAHGALFCLGLFAHLGQFFGRTVTAIGGAAIDQLLGDFGMTFPAGELIDGRFIRLQSEPRQAVKNGVDRPGRGSLAICIFYSQQILAAGMAGIKPVEQRSAGAANVQESGRGRGKTGNNAHARFALGQVNDNTRAV